MPQPPRSPTIPRDEPKSQPPRLPPATRMPAVRGDLSPEERLSAAEHELRLLRQDFEALERRVVDRVKHELEDVYRGIEAHVTLAMTHAMEPVKIQLAKIDDIARNTDSIREAMGLKKLALDLEEQAARIVGSKVDTRLKPVSIHNASELIVEEAISGNHSRRVARWYVALAIISTLAGLIGAAAGSHVAVSAPQPPPAAHH